MHIASDQKLEAGTTWERGYITDENCKIAVEMLDSMW